MALLENFQETIELIERNLYTTLSRTMREILSQKTKSLKP